MDWNLRMPPWEMAELVGNAEPNIGSIVGSSSGMGIQLSGRGLDCSVDLKLGDFGSAEKWKDNMRAPVSSSGKRARALSNSSQKVLCLVDGCRSDLSGCKEYHRRHKVCDTHSKTPIVMVGGQEQRFCQQCSRFHLIVEFDEVKRSCRKRLDGHNRRRRKPQPESINSASMFSNHQGTRFSSYPQTFPTAASDPTWPVIVKSEEEPLYTRHSPMDFLNRQHHHFPVSLPRSFKEGKNFPFSQETDRLCQPLPRTIASDESSNNNGGKILSVLDSDCALSLLSSPPQASAINLGQISDRIPMGQPLLSYGGGLGLGRYSGSHQASNRGLTTGVSCPEMEDENVGSTVLVSDSCELEMNCQGFFGVGGEGSSDGGSQALPFSWQ